ncbi:2,5-diketo-D-gluconate reductase A [Conyzicola nivalis]|uniref:2,5-diketo-D-gluconate reductase A n=1 Tax=Conyzicola nivalis TaxID=1477021 RepID=A0ABV2QPD0_9MICO
MSTTVSVPTVTLNNGVEMPQLGFGVWQITPDERATEAVLTAFDAGYRAVDTARIYTNEGGVGAALEASNLARSDVFVTTKLWNNEQGYDSVLRAFDNSLAKLGTDYIDMYLVHWPVPFHNRYVETWRAFEKLYADGRVRAIGVSNFEPDHLRTLLDSADVVPALNQIEFHPYLQQHELFALHRELGIATESWSPLGQGTVLGDPVIRAIADRLGRTPAQVILRWQLQLGNIVVPKSATESRIRENIALFDFELSEDDMAAFAAIHRGERVGQHPNDFIDDF